MPAKVSRRWLRIGLLAVMHGSALVGCAGRGPAGALTVDVDRSRLGPVLPEDFVGLSMEASVVDSKLLDPAASNLGALLRNLGSGRLRIGGNSLDRVTAWLADPSQPLPAWARARVTPDDLSRLGALAAATRWRVDLGLGLGHSGPAAATTEAVAAARLVGPGLASVELGNEPDLFAGDPAIAPGGYPYDRYRAAVDTFRAALSEAEPDLAFGGPDTAGTGWLVRYVSDEHRGLSFVSQHFYPLSRCGGAQPTVAQLLSAQTTGKEVATIDAALAAAQPQGLPVRLDETNSASCGGQDGVSNTMASALWALRYLLLAGQRGVAGVNLQTGVAACRGYSPLCLPGATGAVAGSAPGIDPVADASLGAGAADGGRLAVQPEYYGLLLVRQLEGGRWLNIRLQRSSPLALFAVQMPDRSVKVVVDNPDAHFSGDILLHAAGLAGVTTVLRLTGPSLAATGGVHLGTGRLGADGVWAAQPDQRLAATAGGVRVLIGPASAVLITLPAPAVSR